MPSEHPVGARRKPVATTAARPFAQGTPNAVNCVVGRSASCACRFMKTSILSLRRGSALQIRLKRKPPSTQLRIYTLVRISTGQTRIAALLDGVLWPIRLFMIRDVQPERPRRNRRLKKGERDNDSTDGAHWITTVVLLSFLDRHKSEDDCPEHPNSM